MFEKLSEKFAFQLFDFAFQQNFAFQFAIF